MGTIRFAALFSHPAQYFAPVFRELDSRDEIDLTVYYCSKQGLETTTDAGFGIDLQWDVPLVEGYDCLFLDNYSPFPQNSTVADNINPGVIGPLRSGRHDVLYVNGYTSLTNWFSFAGASLYDVPLVFRGAATLDNPPGPVVRSIKRFVLRRLFSYVDAFTAVGTRNAAYFRSFGVSNDAITTAANAVDNQYFQRAASELPSKQVLRDELDLGEAPIILFVGKLVDHKRPGLLIRAFDDVRESRDATLVFVGDGALRDELEAAASRLGCADDVVFTGFKNQSELPKYYKTADIFVLPSSRETWGLVVNEAMNFSLPIVASDSVGAVPDLVDDRNGRVVPTDDRAALADALEALATSSSLRSDLGAVSRERIDQWGIEQTADGIVEAARIALTERD